MQTLRRAAIAGVPVSPEPLKFWLERLESASAAIAKKSLDELKTFRERRLARQTEPDGPEGPPPVSPEEQALRETLREEAKFRSQLGELSEAAAVVEIKAKQAESIRAFDDLKHLLATGKYEPALKPPTGVPTPPSAGGVASAKAAPGGAVALATEAAVSKTGGVGSNPGENGGGEGAGKATAVTVRRIGDDDASKGVAKHLGRPITMQFPNETPLEDMLKYITSATTRENDPGLSFYIDPEGLAEAERAATSPIQIDLEGRQLRTVLSLALNQLGLVYIVRDGVVIITTESRVGELDKLLDGDDLKLSPPPPAAKPAGTGLR